MSTSANSLGPLSESEIAKVSVSSGPLFNSIRKLTDELWNSLFSIDNAGLKLVLYSYASLVDPAPMPGNFREYYPTNMEYLAASSTMNIR
jgi:hypothetical protein